MKNVIKIFSLICLLLMTTILLSACVSGIVSEKEYHKLFSGVNAFYNEEESINYEMKLLVDNKEFNHEIESKQYCKLDINLQQNCQIKGIVFLVRSSENVDLEFTVFNDLEIVKNKTKFFTKNSSTEVDLFFENTLNISTSNEFYIEIKQPKNEDKKVSFQFDSLVIFLEE